MVFTRKHRCLVSEIGAIIAAAREHNRCVCALSVCALTLLCSLGMFAASMSLRVTRVHTLLSVLRLFLLRTGSVVVDFPPTVIAVTTYLGNNLHWNPLCTRGSESGSTAGSTAGSNEARDIVVQSGYIQW